MNQHDSLPRIDAVPAGRCAFFLDFDGTLAPIASNPDEVSVPSFLIPLLDRLQNAVGGALAILSGRSIADIDRFLSPLTLPIAGTHGLERRTVDGRISHGAVDRAALEAAISALKEFAEPVEGLIVETKPGSVTLHFRQAPDREQQCLALARQLAAAHPGLHLLLGKKVIELKAGVADKGQALLAFMEEAPFKGRVPLFAGDDVTDEDVFVALRPLDGISIKVGDGETAAGHRAADIAAFHDWLQRMEPAMTTHHSAPKAGRISPVGS